jgi:hypothetical protein
LHQHLVSLAEFVFADASHLGGYASIACSIKHPAAHRSVQHWRRGIIKRARNERASASNSNIGVCAFAYKTIAYQDALLGTFALRLNQRKDVASERGGLDFTPVPTHIGANDGAECFRRIECGK